MRESWSRHRSVLKSLPLVSLFVLCEAVVLVHLVRCRYDLTVVANWAIPGRWHAVVRCVLVGLWTTFFSLLAASCALSFLPRRPAKALWIALLVLLALELTYRYSRGAVLDPQLLAFNSDVFFHASYWKVVGVVAGYRAPAVLAGVIALSLLGRRLELWALPREAPPMTRLALMAAAPVLIFFWRDNRSVALADVYESSDVYFLGRGLADLRRGSFGVDQDVLSRTLKTWYPFLRHGGSRGPASRPNVFVVLLESFPGELVGRPLPGGGSNTPTLDRLRARSLYVRRFYSNSIQTAPGFTSTHCGLIPSVRKIAAEYQDDAFRCLPAILQDAGYQTVLYYPTSGDFDNTDLFFGKNGFRDIVTLDGALPEPDCSARVLMGLRDDCVYKNVFKDLDRRHAEGRLGPGHPVYAGLLTTVTHFPFAYPQGFPKPIAQPGSAAEDQRNAAYLADRFLRDFLAGLAARPYLKDSLVVIVGDHSYPASAGARDSVQTSNEIGLTARHVWVPFFLSWPGRVAPRQILSATYSQLDIAPTILDLLGLSVDDAFVGRSIARPDTGAAAPLVQPFSGQILGAIRYPYLYKLDRRRRGESVTYLAGGEEREIAIDSIDPRVLATLRRATQQIFVNERLLATDRVFPGPNSALADNRR